jgi:hypothetical protein
VDGKCGELPNLFATIVPNGTLLGSISSSFYSSIFRTKVCSKPNSKQKKAVQKTFV